MIRETNEQALVGTVPCFLTGSHAYGKPHVKSDTDLVVLLDEETLEVLQDQADPDSQNNGGYAKEDACCLRFGKLNLLCCLNKKHFDAWREGTEELVARQPVSRAEAIAFLSALRHKNGIKF